MFPSETGYPPQPGSRTLAGLALQWNVGSTIDRQFVEVFTPGALSWPTNLEMCVGHVADKPIARLDHGSWRIAETAQGLWVELDCPDTPQGDEWLHGTRFGTFFGWSICFRGTTAVRTWFWPEDKFDLPVCTISQATLLEVSIVRRPAHQTVIGVKSRLRKQGICGPFDDIP